MLSWRTHGLLLEVEDNVEKEVGFTYVESFVVECVDVVNGDLEKVVLAEVDVSMGDLAKGALGEVVLT